MHTINVKTATRESAEQFKTDKFQRYCVIDDNERLDFIPALFFTPTADNMSPAGYASIPIMMAVSGTTGSFRRVLVEMWHRTKLSSLLHKPDISHLQENNDITCAFLVIILNQRSVPMLPELLQR